MEQNPDDEKVIDLLSKLKDTNGRYPSDILAARRKNYLKQVANVGLGIGIGAGLNKNTPKGGGSGGTVTTVTSKILESALIAAIVLEAGTVAYLYRDKIADVVRTYTGSSNVQDMVVQPEEDATAASELLIPTITKSNTPSITPSVTPSGTPSAEIAGESNNANDASLGVNATPTPGGNNGNHYGNTPKPERTKEQINTNNNDGNGGNGGNGGNNNNTNGNKNK